MLIMKLLFINKILQIWKLFFFTETTSHHTLQIFKSLIYIWAILLFFAFMQKIMTLLCIHLQFCKEKNIYLNLMRNFVQTWFCIDTKMMRAKLCVKKFISCKNAKLFVETLFLFHHERHLLYPYHSVILV